MTTMTLRTPMEGFTWLRDLKIATGEGLSGHHLDRGWSMQSMSSSSSGEAVS